ncbi:hypothetical protein [Terrabacter aerolatus]|uniref:hypothetical protein n=1 Tax=Terrabacter aerolatus TaxID=422442 RepID=UPI0011BF8249
MVLIAVALGSSGHGFWWLFGLFWMLPHVAGRSHGCVGRAGGTSRRGRLHDETAPSARPVQSPSFPSQPDPTRDRHEAFPSR